jgi:dihydroorotate dehydrogenase (fumarate)
MLLAGAQTVQVASVLYKKGFEEISRINQGIETWMNEHQFKTIDEFRGRMGLANIDNLAAYERVQFMKKRKIKDIWQE